MFLKRNWVATPQLLMSDSQRVAMPWALHRDFISLYHCAWVRYRNIAKFNIIGVISEHLLSALCVLSHLISQAALWVTETTIIASDRWDNGDLWRSSILPEDKEAALAGGRIRTQTHFSESTAEIVSHSAYRLLLWVPYLTLSVFHPWSI